MTIGKSRYSGGRAEDIIACVSNTVLLLLLDCGLPFFRREHSLHGNTSISQIEPDTPSAHRRHTLVLEGSRHFRAVSLATG
jgi:hypothetical protein